MRPKQPVHAILDFQAPAGEMQLVGVGGSIKRPAHQAPATRSQQSLFSAKICYNHGGFGDSMTLHIIASRALQRHKTPYQDTSQL